MLLIPVFAFIGFWVFLTLATLIVPYEMFGLTTLLMLVGIVAGGIVGDIVSKNIVRRKRIRSHSPNTCYRCKNCSKVFLAEKQ